MTKLQQRILDNCAPEPNTGCWLWLLSLTRVGYGRIQIGGRAQGAHRISYEAFRGPVPKSVQLDHRCRMRSCVNPEHLEPVTQRTNILRGESFSAINAAKTHCANGHEFTAENTYVKATGARNCRTCLREMWRNAERRKRQVV